jgi:lipopolysaccharide export LptBFGC system permease protein LptF
VARPDSDDERAIAVAEHVAAQSRSPRQRFATRGKQFDYRFPLYVGLMASAGVAVTYGLVRGSASGALVLIGAALFFAFVLGLEPAVPHIVRINRA